MMRDKNKKFCRSSKEQMQDSQVGTWRSLELEKPLTQIEGILWQEATNILRLSGQRKYFSRSYLLSLIRMISTLVTDQALSLPKSSNLVSIRLGGYLHESSLHILWTRISTHPLVMFAMNSQVVCAFVADPEMGYPPVLSLFLERLITTKFATNVVYLDVIGQSSKSLQHEFYLCQRTLAARA
jgi:hypothetical protein